MTNQNQKKQLNCELVALIDLSTERQQAITGGKNWEHGCVPIKDKNTKDEQKTLVNLSLQF